MALHFKFYMFKAVINVFRTLLILSERVCLTFQHAVVTAEKASIILYFDVLFNLITLHLSTFCLTITLRTM